MFLREIWDRIIVFLRRLFGRQVKEPDLTEKKAPPRKWWEFPFRIIKTGIGGINMPKRQTCPGCGALAKRKEKTRTGAIYSCRCKTTFSVAAPKPRVGMVSKRREEPLFVTSGAMVKGRTRY